MFSALYGVHTTPTMNAEGVSWTSAHGGERVSASLAPGRTADGTEVAVQPEVLPLRPFRNTGCSCYANTSLQLFGTDSAFVQTLEEHTCEAQCIFCHLKHDLQRHASTPVAFVPRLHLRSVELEMPGAPEWSNGEQQDVSEFAQAIIRGIDRCANADSLRADFYNRFGNRVQDRLGCTHCGHVRDWRSETSDSVFFACHEMVSWMCFN